MRSKEEAHDYRYFPEPDLLPVLVDDARVAAIAGSMPELPDRRRQRFMSELALSEYDASQLTQSKLLADYFEAAVAAGAPPKLASNWITGELARALNASDRPLSSSPVSPSQLADLIALIEKGTISGAMAKRVFEKMFATSQPAEQIVLAEGLAQIDDDAQIATLIHEVLDKNADAVTQYRAGKSATFGFLVGQVMKAASGKANPKRVNDLLKKML
jgi:aspartyl-tRNA(Asn)/glutamyl-tRNA(Gln) amidotransferase subunit B